MARTPQDIDALREKVREQKREIDRLRRKHAALIEADDRAGGCLKTALFAAVLMALLMGILVVKQHYFP